jgi:argininosuccinate lyase
MKSLPLAYNKDMQEDKESLFDSVETIEICFDVLIQMLPGVQFHPDNMKRATKEGFLLATDFADYLAQKGLPFRQAHEIIGKMVQHAVKKNRYLEDFDLDTLKKFSKKFETDVFKTVSLKNSVNARKTEGGTAKTCVENEIKRAKNLLRTK